MDIKEIKKLKENELYDFLDKRVFSVSELVNFAFSELLKKQIDELKKSIDNFNKKSEEYSRTMITLTRVLIVLTILMVIPIIKEIFFWVFNKFK